MLRYMLRYIALKEVAIFNELEEICVLVLKSAEKLNAMLKFDCPFDELTLYIKKMEKNVEQNVYKIVEKLHQSSIAPFERQNIFRIATGLGDILDAIETVSSLLKLYDPKQRIDEAQEIALALIQSVRAVDEMVGLLRTFKDETTRIFELAEKVKQLENDADRLYQNAISRLFQEEIETRELIKWKDILEKLEVATNRCEEVSEIIDSIVLEDT
jgi:uncharacterized protein Yka (UPF0111/DUF47 family)